VRSGRLQNYGATRDSPEKSIPVFEEMFNQCAEDVNAYLLDATNYADTLPVNTKLETLMLIHKTLVEERPVSFEDCVVWARVKNCRKSIKKLLLFLSVLLFSLFFLLQCSDFMAILYFIAVACLRF